MNSRGNDWSEIIHHKADSILELRWLPVEMTDGAFKATLVLFAWEAESLRPRYLLVDASQFRHQFGEDMTLMTQWRHASVIPRYGAAGIKKFAFHMPKGFPNTMEAGGKEVIDGPAIYPTAWFSERQHAIDWFKSA